MKFLKVRNNSLLLELSFFCLVLSQSIVLINKGFDQIIFYIGLFFLVLILLDNSLKLSEIKDNKLFKIIVFLGLTIGLAVQDMSIYTKINAIIPSIIFFMIFTMSSGIIYELKTLRNISYSIILSLTIALILAIFRKITLFESNGLGGVVYFGFNGGILYKNYFSSTVLAALIGLYVYMKYGKKFNIMDIILSISLLILLFLSSSNGTYLILFSFIMVELTGKIVIKVKRSQRKYLVFFVIFIGLSVFYLLFNKIALNNQNYIYRINGLTYYLQIHGNDRFHLLFGNGELAYSSERNYVENIISSIGWDASLELSWLGILIKNGLLGVFTYVYVFLHYIIEIIKVKNSVIKKLFMSTFVAIIMSSLVETYIQNIHVVFGIYMFIFAFNIDNLLIEYKK